MKRGPYKKYNLCGSTEKIPARTLRRWKKEKKISSKLIEKKIKKMHCNIILDSPNHSTKEFENFFHNAQTMVVNEDEHDIIFQNIEATCDQTEQDMEVVVEDQNEFPSSFTPNYEHETQPKKMINVLLAMVTKWRRNLTYTTTTDILRLLNIHTGTCGLNSLKYYFKKIRDQYSPHFEYHHICQQCGAYLGKMTDRYVTCQKCSSNIDLKLNENFFMYLPLKDQLREIFETTKAHNLYSQVRQKSCQYGLEDIYDGKIYKKIMNNESNIISVNFSVDGAPIFDSSNNSAYPLLCTINELSPKERRNHVMMCSIWFGSGKPRCMNGYLTPFVEEAQKLYSEGFNYTFEGSQYTKKVIILMGVCDSVARPLVRCATQYNGMYGCGLCLHPGVTEKKGKGTVRVYPIIKGNAFGDGLRTHENTLNHATMKIMGIKKRSVLCDIPHYDIVNNLDADWMHCVALGVCRQFTNLWFDSKNHGNPFYLRKIMDEFDSILTSYSVTLDVSRTPRSILERRHWKAHEWVMFLLCYSLPILKLLIPKKSRKYLAHWALLVEGIAILLKESIKPSEVVYAQKCLDVFIAGVEELYGIEHVSFNVHLLAHLPTSVKNWGPLWTHSAFIYEDFNQIIKSYVHSPNGVGIQICNSFRLKCVIHKLMMVCEPEMTEDQKSYVRNLLSQKSMPKSRIEIGGVGVLGRIAALLELSAEQYSALRRLNIRLDETGTNFLEFFRCISHNKEILYGRKYKPSTETEPKKKNYNVILKNGKIFQISSFLAMRNNNQDQTYITGYYYKRQKHSLLKKKNWNT